MAIFTDSKKPPALMPHTLRIVACIALTIKLLFSMGCRPDEFSTNPNLLLHFSADTVAFDTVFSNVTTATHTLKVYNHSSSHLRIAHISLAGGATSPYDVNLDGISGHQFADIALRAHDSLFVFVRITPPPLAQDTPLCMADSLLFITNGNHQRVQLQAWGQDVVQHRNPYFASDTTLRANRPHLIYGTMTVAEGATLRIEAGAKLHFHPKASLDIRGSLIAEGTEQKPIMLEGDRIEPYYRDKAGQWNGLRLAASCQVCNLQWVHIRNCITAIQANGLADTMRLNHCKITSCSHIGLTALGINIVANNCLFANAANSCVDLHGGAHRFTHCTVANYWGGFTFRNGAALQMSSPDTLPPIAVVFENSIVYGSASNEMTVWPIESNYTFNHCVLRIDTDTTDIRLRNSIFSNPKFKNPAQLNFMLESTSPAIDRADINISTLFPIDLNGKNRLDDGSPDIGAFEYTADDENAE